MERNKLETQFKEQLNSREIKPSDMAWEKLDAMLTVAEEKKPRHSHNWIYIAASIIGFAFLGTFFFSQSNKNGIVENQEIVIENSQKVLPKKETLSIIPKESKPEIVVVTSEVRKVKRNFRDSNPTTKKQVSQNSNSNGLNPMVEKSQSNPKTEQFASSNINDKSVDEMLAAVKTSKSDNSKTTVKVNPNTLLSQVDGELELSFREKVINKVNKNYQTVKVVLANRNQE